MERYRTYGVPPFRVMVVHGGPGALGTMAPVARELAAEWGAVETLHTARAIEGQVEELRTAIMAIADAPVAVVGHSWGAMLGYLFAARYPELVRKLILVGSGVFADRYAAGIDATRSNRLSAAEREEEQALVEALEDPTRQDADMVFTRLGALSAKADAYDPLPYEEAELPAQYEVFRQVWPEAQALRASGALLAAGRSIACLVVAIHGDYDPHPAEGIREPLGATLRDFRMVVLERCGHEPWQERQAQEAFYRLLREELAR